MSSDITVEDVERVLAVGRLLTSVLKPGEIESLRQQLGEGRPLERGPPARIDTRQVTPASLDGGTHLP